MPDLVERIIATIDRRQFAELAERHRSDYAAKYLDLPKWIGRNLQRVQRAGLDRGHRRRVLDLGCGCGYFLYIARLLGHEVIGIDNAPAGSLFAAMTELLGVPVVTHSVRAFEALPDVGHVDVLTAHMITFNGHHVAPWGAGEWHALLSQFPGVSVSLQMNREPDKTLYPPGLREYFEAIGAQIAGPRVFIERLPSERSVASALAKAERAAEQHRMRHPTRG